MRSRCTRGRGTGLARGMWRVEAAAAVEQVVAAGPSGIATLPTLTLAVGARSGTCAGARVGIGAGARDATVGLAISVGIVGTVRDSVAVRIGVLGVLG